MTTDTFDQRWQQIGAVWREYVLEYRILLIVALVVTGLWVFGSNGFNLAGDMLGYITNIATESLSIIVTVLILDRLNQRRTEQRAEAALKEDLVRRAGSLVNNFALDAISELRKRRWLEGKDGLLKGADLSGANLKKAYLSKANLQNAFLWKAQLQGADLWEADLQGANLLVAQLQETKLYKAQLQGAGLYMAQLQGADLRKAQLQGADLRAAQLQRADLHAAQMQEATLSRAQLQGADLRAAQMQEATLNGAQLQKADLREAQLQKATLHQAQLQESNLLGAQLRGTSLRGAQLQGANLIEADLVNAVRIQDAEFDEQTLLPDAECQRDAEGKLKWDDKGNLLFTPNSYWAPDTDMTRYTDPEHPDFWQPEWDETDASR